MGYVQRRARAPREPEHRARRAGIHILGKQKSHPPSSQPDGQAGRLRTGTLLLPARPSSWLTRRHRSTSSRLRSLTILTSSARSRRGRLLVRRAAAGYLSTGPSRWSARSWRPSSAWWRARCCSRVSSRVRPEACGARLTNCGLDSDRTSAAYRTALRYGTEAPSRERTHGAPYGS